MTRFCKKCLYPDTKPQLNFDENGVCDACIAAEKKEQIDWDGRKEELKQLVEKYKCKDGTKYDCIIPVSGGKDSRSNSCDKRLVWIEPTISKFCSN